MYRNSMRRAQELLDMFRQQLGLLKGTEMLAARQQNRLEVGQRLVRGCPANQRLAKHLRHEQPHLFTFLQGDMAKPSSRELHALRNLISEADLILETSSQGHVCAAMSLPTRAHNRRRWHPGVSELAQAASRLVGAHH